MKLNRWTAAGTFALLAGVLMLGLAYASTGIAQAGNQIPCDATPTATQAPVGQIQAAFQVAPCTATSTQSPSVTATVKFRTHTPTATATSVPSTNTPVPPTARPATNTPTGGNEGVNVKPPNTGSGDGLGNGSSLWLVILGGAALAIGGGAVLTGLRRR